MPSRRSSAAEPPPFISEQFALSFDRPGLIAGVDVQKNRLVYVVRGFGVEMFSALIEHGEALLRQHRAMLMAAHGVDGEVCQHG